MVSHSLVVGQVRLSQERASAKAFSGLDSKMRAVRDTSPESMQGVSGIAAHGKGFAHDCLTISDFSQARSQA